MTMFGSFLFTMFALFRFVYTLAFFFTGSHVNIRDEFERSPLHYAARSGEAGVTRLLLEKGEFTFLFELISHQSLIEHIVTHYILLKNIRKSH